MKTYISILVAVIATLFAVNASAWNPPASPAPKSWISDVGGTLSPEAHARLDTQLRQINSGSANELAVLILPSLEGENIEDVANATFKAWGVGKKDLDNGVLIVLAMKEHKTRIETGKGVEGDLPDLKSHDIQINVINPRMKQHKVELALSEGFAAISTSVANHKAEAEAAKARAANPTPTATATTSTPTPSQPICDASNVGSHSGVWALLIMAMAALVIFMARRLTRKSPPQVEVAPPVQKAKLYTQPVSSPPVSVVAPPPPPVAPPAPKKAKAKVSGMTNIPKTPPRPTPKAPVSKPMKKSVMPTVVATSAVATELAAAAAATRARAQREREEREEETRRARRAQEAREEREEEERRRKRREEDEERSSSSSSSTFDWGGGSSGGGSDSGSGGFGGGDSGGGGSSSDW